MFWQLVRDKRFLGLKFRRQHQMGDYILDFYCHEARTAIELDGPIHETRIKKDAKRDAYLESQGIRLIRIKNEDFLGAPEQIMQQLAVNLPLPLGEGGGEGGFSEPLNRKGHVLMIDARNIYRKVTRKIYDFSPEQLQNLTAIVWLYRGQSDRFLALVQEYLTRTITEAGAISNKASAFREAYDVLTAATGPFLKTLRKDSLIRDLVKERDDGAKACFQGLDRLTARIAKDWKKPGEKKLAAQKKLLAELDALAEACRDLVKDIDLVYKLATRLVDTAEKDAGARDHDAWDGRAIGRLEKELDAARKDAVEQLKTTAYFHRQAHWLLSRFPDAKLVPVPGLCRVVTRADIEAADWSLTPGRYVGVAPPEVDEDFDFEQALRDIHVELADLNREAVALAAKIQTNFERLGI
jgi:type I restriction enzyme M protein